MSGEIYSYENSTYKDFQIFIPYDELHIGDIGTSYLKFHVVILDDNHNKLVSTDYFNFSYTQ